ncbi:hypothetical protein SODALDRAFT_326772, partial [Sodiomyces alkalinus F11]
MAGSNAVALVPLSRLSTTRSFMMRAVWKSLARYGAVVPLILNLRTLALAFALLNL